MAHINDGGPAFPHTGPQRDCGMDGMSLRDYFAAKALQGMHARDTYDEGQATPDQRAALAYLDADAMLRARTAQSPRERQDAQESGR